MITAASQSHSNTNCSAPPQPRHAWWSEGFPVVFHSFVLSCSEKPRSMAFLWQCKLALHYGLELSASSCLCPTSPTAKGSALTLSQQQASVYCFWWLTPKQWQQQEGFFKRALLSPPVLKASSPTFFHTHQLLCLHLHWESMFPPPPGGETCKAEVGKAQTKALPTGPQED